MNGDAEAPPHPVLRAALAPLGERGQGVRGSRRIAFVNSQVGHDTSYPRVSMPFRERGALPHQPPGSVLIERRDTGLAKELP